MRILASMTHSGLRDPRLAGVQFTHVRFSRDLSVCRVWYVPGPSGPGATAASLRSASGYIRRRLGESFGLRRQPELRFVLDDSQTRGDALTELIEDSVRKDARARGQRAPTPAKRPESGQGCARARAAPGGTARSGTTGGLSGAPMNPSGASRSKRDVSGVLLLDKPQGLTSNQAVQRVKRLFAARKAGHTGSLDPIATGMLPLCLGEATKLSAYLLKADKRYRVTARIGCKTDTGDATGATVLERPPWRLDRTELEAVLERFTGEVEQVPPMYSALKHKGQRLYKLAREGRTVERAPRRVWIRSLEIEEYSPSAPVFSVSCGSGVYVRTLIEDLAESLGALACVSALRRLGVAPFGEAAMVTMEGLEAAAAKGYPALDAMLLPADAAVGELPAVHLSASESFYVQHGNPVAAARGARPGVVRLYIGRQQFIGIGEVTLDGQVAPRRLLRLPPPAVAE